MLDVPLGIFKKNYRTIHLPTMSSIHFIRLQSLCSLNVIPFNGDQTSIFYIPSVTGLWVVCEWPSHLYKEYPYFIQCRLILIWEKTASLHQGNRRHWSEGPIGKRKQISWQLSDKTGKASFGRLPDMLCKAYGKGTVNAMGASNRRCLLQAPVLYTKPHDRTIEE